MAIVAISVVLDVFLISEPIHIFLWVILAKHFVITNNYFNVAFMNANRQDLAELVVFKLQIFTKKVSFAACASSAIA